MNGKRISIIVAIGSSLAAFILLFVGVAVLLDNSVQLKNIVAYAVYSAIVGLIAYIFAGFKGKWGLSVYGISVVIGFFSMYHDFLNSGTGWGDLTGILSLFFWTIIGVIGASIAQLLYYFIYRQSNDSGNK